MRSDMIKKGYEKAPHRSLLRATGGFLVLDALDVLAEPGVWPALKRTLRTRVMEAARRELVARARAARKSPKNEDGDGGAAWRPSYLDEDAHGASCHEEQEVQP